MSKRKAEDMMDAPRAKKAKSESYFQISGDEMEAEQTPAEWLSNLTFSKGSTPIISIDGESSVLEALKLLSSEDIQSAPVHDSTTVVGVVDLLDVVHHISDYLKDLQDATPDALKALKIDPADVAPMQTKVKDMMGCSGRNPFETIADGEPLPRVISLLGDLKMHRVYMTEPEGTCASGVVSQSSFLQWVVANLSNFPSMDKTITELGIVEPGAAVVTVKERTPVIEAFRLMVDKKVSAVGVVDRNDKLTNVISARDVKTALGTKGLDVASLFLDTLSFVAKCRQASLEEKSPRITVTADTTLEKTAKLLAITRIHRVFVTKDGKPVGVCALRDVIQQLMV